MATEPLPRLDSDIEIRNRLNFWIPISKFGIEHFNCADHDLTYCRLKPGDIWEDPVHGHRVGVLDVTCPDAVLKMMGGKKAKVAVNET